MAVIRRVGLIQTARTGTLFHYLSTSVRLLLRPPAYFLFVVYNCEPGN